MTKLLPMLAHDFKKRGHDIVWPAYVQPKLNGIRCLAHKVDEGNIWYISRGGKNFTTLGHLDKTLLERMKVGDVLDGELFSEKLLFEEIVSAVKRQKTQNPDIFKLQYWIYDCINEKPYKERLEYIINSIERHELGLFIRSVPTYVAPNKETLAGYHLKFIKSGFEGTMIRNVKGMYARDSRSIDLQKLKDFIDEEFTIIGGRSGEGKEVGCVVFICETEDGKEFDCRPKGTYEKRKLWLNDLSNIVGKKLTVRYQNRSEKNTPIFPVGVTIRDYE
jgi:ATP-dependent DNA ligase